MEGSATDAAGGGGGVRLRGRRALGRLLVQRPRPAEPRLPPRRRRPLQEQVLPALHRTMQRAPLMCRAGQPWRPGKPRRPEHADVWGFGLQQQPSVI